jgi:hypothetical protein
MSYLDVITCVSLLAQRDREIPKDLFMMCIESIKNFDQLKSTTYKIKPYGSFLLFSALLPSDFDYVGNGLVIENGFLIKNDCYFDNKEPLLTALSRNHEIDIFLENSRIIVELWLQYFH